MGVFPAVIIGIVMTMVTAAALVWLRGKRGARLVQASIADVYYDGYGVWAYSSNGPGEYFPAYISVNPVS